VVGKTANVCNIFAPEQVKPLCVYVGITVISDVNGAEFDGFVPVKDGKLPLPVGANPVPMLLLFQVKAVYVPV
jgi:hypothetical protein